MTRQIFTVYDSAAGAYLDPFTAQSRGAAIRSFQDAVRDPQHPFHKHPDDYTLFYIGDYDPLSGKVEPAVHATLGNAVEYSDRAEGPAPMKVAK